MPLYAVDVSFYVRADTPEEAWDIANREASTLPIEVFYVDEPVEETEE